MLSSIPGPTPAGAKEVDERSKVVNQRIFIKPFYSPNPSFFLWFNQQLFK
jgi:hypothetical protein